MIVFSGVALFVTSLWNKGFILDYSPEVFFKTMLLVALFYYLVLPISKVIFIPINFLTLGLLSSVLYFALFYIFITRFSLVQIKPWEFPGLQFYLLNLPSAQINYLLNIALSSVSLSFIIRMLELFL